MLRSDRTAAKKEIERCVRAANHVDAENPFLLNRMGGQEVHIRFELVLQSLLSSKGEAFLNRINPSLDRDVTILSAMSAMLHTSRVSQIKRCIAAALDLLRELEDDTKVEDAEEKQKSLMLKSTRLASSISSKRHFVSKSGVFDPRYLVFEFSYGILLRKSQVELVNEFVSRGTMCHQMIMGAGKTTVVAPLLSLMSANEKTLVVEVVPSSLLFFSRSVMRSKFNAIVRRSVYTLQFDRFTTVTNSLMTKLSRAREDRAVVVSTPSAVKSLYLKFVELLSDIDRGDRGEVVRERRGSFTISKITRMLGFKNKTVKETRKEERANQIQTLRSVLSMFRTYCC